MKKYLLWLVIAMSSFVVAQAQQTYVPFTGERGTISDLNQQIVRVSNIPWGNDLGYNSRAKFYVDVVKEKLSSNAKIGIEGWTGDNSWGPPVNSGWDNTAETRQKQFVELNVPGLFTNAYQAKYVKIYVSFVSDPFVKVDGSTNVSKKHLSNWGGTITANNSVELNLSEWFTLSKQGVSDLWLNGTMVEEDKPSYQITTSGSYKLRTFAMGNTGGMREIDFQVVIANSTVAVTGVSLNQTSLTQKVGEAAVQLTATLAPTNATNKNVTWSSSNTGVATVTNGLVSFVGVGTAVITVTSTDGNKTATCNVTVSAADVAVTGVSLSQTSLTQKVGETAVQLTATLAPTNATNKNVTWSSSNTGVATVTNGLVSFVGVGNAVITVTSTDGNKTATCNVTVSAADVAVTGVSLNQTSLTQKVGETAVQLTATLAPTNATNKNVTWSSSNTGVATVTNGLVSFVGVGNAVITVTSTDGNKTATCNVTVSAADVAVTGVSLSQTSLTQKVGETAVQLTATLAPTNATNKNVTWSSSNTGVATVNNGLVSFVGVGNAVITVTSTDGNKTATCNVTVSAQPLIPIFDGLLESYTIGSPKVTLKIVGPTAERFTSFKVNGNAAVEFNPTAAGKYEIEAAASDGSTISTYVEVK